MCGRYTLIQPLGAVAALFGAPGGEADAGLLPRFNTAPTDLMPVLVHADNGPKIQPMQWGMEPPWADARRRGPRMINARSETVAVRPAFRDSFRRRRCLVPADGFYEWERRPSGKQPHWIHRVDGGLFAMAGIWSTPPRAGTTKTFAILTRSAPDALLWLHDRVPVILHHTHWAGWLAPDTALAPAQAMLEAPWPDGIVWNRVSRRVNRPGHDGPDCVQPVDDPDTDPGHEAVVGDLHPQSDQLSLF